MNLHVLPAGPIQTNAYLLTQPESGEAVLIDAPGEVWADVAPILTAEKCRLTELWLTHGHWDHTQGGAEVVVDAWVAQGDRFEALGTTVEVRHVPGHCPGNVLFYFAAEDAAFVGDALFKGSIGRTDLPGGDFDELDRSIREQIYTLPAATGVFPGHGPKTTVAGEKAGNPYVHD